MVRLWRNTKLSNVTNAHSLGDSINSDTKKAMTAQTTSFGFVVIADDHTHGGNPMHDRRH
jgi:hypothetical protein